MPNGTRDSRLPVSETFENIEDLIGIGCFSQATAEACMVEEPGYFCQYLYVIAPAVFRSQNNKDEVDRFPVERAEVHTFARAEKAGHQPIHSVCIRVRYCNSMSDPRTHHILALDHMLEGFLVLFNQVFRIEVPDNGLEQFLFPRWREIEYDCLMAEEFA